ncbi:MAG: sigma-70 family RNA polymerase sigma factor [Deltaproteobacteria bacterium]|nr:sigma-70 family RNA polymerase sigma factor [Deltaproteobacteria bacterium]
MMHSINSRDERRGSAKKKSRSKRSLQEDLKLVRRAQKDRAAADQLMARLAPKVRHAVYLAVGRDEEADDLTHVCLLQILENLGNYKGTGSVDAWAGRLSYRVIMRHLSRRRRSERTVSLVPIDTGVSSSDPEQESARGRLGDRLMHHLQKLPKERRVTLILRLVYQHSVAEVAEMTETPINTVRDRIRTGLKELRQSILRDPEAREFLFEERHG